MERVKLKDGLVGSVWQAALNLDAVIRPALKRNHILLLAWSLVWDSTAAASASVTVIFEGN